MTEITAAMVKQLRDSTGAGMMECKKALVEAKGDVKLAEELIAKSGHKKAAKTASRTAAEGRIVIARNPQSAVMVEINCETDFVARDESFVQFCQGVADTALNTNGDLEALMNATMNGMTVEDARKAIISRLGENIQVRRLMTFKTAANQRVGDYIHMTRIGALVMIEGGTDALARDLAMHVAAMKPQYMNFEDVPAAFLDKEKEIQMEVAKQSGKPENILEKIVTGQIQKKLNEICLVGQGFFKDPDTTVGALLKTNQAKLLQICRFEVGEGIEVIKKSFEEEVIEARGGK